MKKRFPDLKTLERHPCFNVEAHHKFGRIHLPVAPFCNIHCRYCDRKYDCVNESRPGVSSRIVNPDEGIQRVRVAMDRGKNISVIGVAGPGDPLANNSTFEFFEMVKQEFSEVMLCLSTNGLYLPEKLSLIKNLGIRTITITINAATEETAQKIYSWVSYGGEVYRERDAAECLLCNQWKGLRKAVKEGFAVKVNTVLIPTVNEEEIPLIAWLAGVFGATTMNIIPLIPQAEFKHLQRPSYEMLQRIRENCSHYIHQITHCKHCRADAYGVLGEDKDIELELLNAKIGEVYCEYV
ncbi:radical SAM protein [Thermodesulfovibrio sp. TK110]